MRITIAAVLAALLTVSGSAQEFIADPGAPASAFPNPDRPVADIVSPIWHNEKERDVAGEPRQLVRLLGIKSGMTVADIGAGSGYYVVRLSLIVGPRGRVIAEDVVPEYLRGLRRRVRDLGLQNVAIGLGEPHDPRLPTDSLDVAILAHMYHEIAQPYALLYNLIPHSSLARASGAQAGIRTAVGATLAICRARPIAQARPLPLLDAGSGWVTATGRLSPTSTSRRSLDGGPQRAC